MIYRKLTREEHILTRPLYEECFPEDEKCFVDYYYQSKAVINEIWAAQTEKGRIVSMLQANPVEVTAFLKTGERKEFRIPYLVAIGTAAEYRRQGLMRHLMEMALEQFRQEKLPFTFLMPASEAYYLPFGFVRAWDWTWEEDALMPWSAFLERESGGGQASDTLERESGGGQASDTLERESGGGQASDTLEKESGGGQMLNSGQEQGRPFLSEKLCRVCDLTDDQLQQMADFVNHCLENSYSMSAKRTVPYYRDLELQQKASGGELLFRYTPAGECVCAVCTEKEAFPSMMIRVIDQEAFEKILRRSTEPEQNFTDVMICEVV